MMRKYRSFGSEDGGGEGEGSVAIEDDDDDDKSGCSECNRTVCAGFNVFAVVVMLREASGGVNGGMLGVGGCCK
jgi:hypothetical protein